MLHDPKRETATKARLVLLNAADYIEENGWCQRTLHMNGRVCLMGAIQAVTCGELLGHDPLSCEITHRLRETLGTFSVASWNDRPGRTKKQVVNALRRAAR